MQCWASQVNQLHTSPSTVGNTIHTSLTRSRERAHEKNATANAVFEKHLVQQNKSGGRKQKLPGVHIKTEPRASS